MSQPKEIYRQLVYLLILVLFCSGDDYSQNRLTIIEGYHPTYHTDFLSTEKDFYTRNEPLS